MLIARLVVLYLLVDCQEYLRRNSLAGSETMPRLFCLLLPPSLITDCAMSFGSVQTDTRLSPEAYSYGHFHLWSAICRLHTGDHHWQGCDYIGRSSYVRGSAGHSYGVFERHVGQEDATHLGLADAGFYDDMRYCGLGGLCFARGVLSESIHNLLGGHGGSYNCEWWGLHIRWAGLGEPFDHD